MKGQPASGVRVFFWTDGYNRSTSGTRIGVGATDDAGRFTISSGTGEPGLEPGAYHVTFSRPIVKGKTFAASDRPEGAVESIPPPYSDHQNPGRSPVVVTVGGENDFTFELPTSR